MRTFSLITLFLILLSVQVFAEDTATVLDEITVLSTRIPAEYSKNILQPNITVVKRADIDNSGAAISQDMLRNITGAVYNDPTGQSGITGSIGLRSFTPGSANTSREIYLLDGVRMINYEQSSVREEMAIVDPLSIDELVVSRGGASTIYGLNGASGVVSFKTRNPDLQKTRIEIESSGGGNSTQNHNYYISYPFNNTFAISTSGRVYQSDGFRDNQLSSGNKGSRTFSSHTKLLKEFNNNDKMTISFHSLDSFFAVLSFYILNRSDNKPNEDTNTLTIPQRIISLGPPVTEQLYILGLGDKLIGNTTFCTRPKEAVNKEKVGTVIDVNIEKVISLKPDIVIATSLTNLNAIKKMEKLGINVIVYPQIKTFNQLCNEFIKLGSIFNKKEYAEKMINKVKIEVNKIKDKTEQLNKTTVFAEIGTEPLFTVTRNSFINDYIKYAGGKNIALDAKSGLYSREEVISKNPDVILIITMGVSGKQEKKVWQRFKTLNAVQKNRIYIIDSYKYCSPTPVVFAGALKDLVSLIHPEINLNE